MSPPPPPPASKYLTPLTVPSFLPLPTDEPVSRTPIQSSPGANCTGPRCATMPSRVGDDPDPPAAPDSTVTGSFSWRGSVLSAMEGIIV